MIKKIFLAYFVIFLFGGCSLFQKKEKYGCPVSAANTGAENADANKKMRKKDRYKGGNKFAY